MTAQTATAMQPAKTLAVAKQTETEKVFDRMQQAYDSIAKRAFEIFDNNGRWFGHDLSDWLQAEGELFHPVHLEITETVEALTFGPKCPDLRPTNFTFTSKGTGSPSPADTNPRKRAQKARRSTPSDARKKSFGPLICHPTLTAQRSARL